MKFVRDDVTATASKNILVQNQNSCAGRQITQSVRDVHIEARNFPSPRPENTDRFAAGLRSNVALKNAPNQKKTRSMAREWHDPATGLRNRGAGGRSGRRRAIAHRTYCPFEIT